MRIVVNESDGLEGPGRWYQGYIRPPGHLREVERRVYAAIRTGVRQVNDTANGPDRASARQSELVAAASINIGSGRSIEP